MALALAEDKGTRRETYSTAILKRTTKTFTCANCAQNFPRRSFSVSGFMKDAKIVIPIIEVISKVFTINSDPTVLNNMDIKLCSTCGKYLAELYKFYELFIELGHLSSQISVLVRGQSQSEEVVKGGVSTSDVHNRQRHIRRVTRQSVRPPTSNSENELDLDLSRDLGVEAHGPDPLEIESNSLHTSSPKSRGTSTTQADAEINPFFNLMNTSIPATTDDPDPGLTTKIEIEDFEPMSMSDPEDFDNVCVTKNLNKPSSSSTTILSSAHTEASSSRLLDQVALNMDGLIGVKVEPETETEMSMLQAESGDNEFIVAKPLEIRPLRQRYKARPAKCPHCEKVLATADTLRVHIRSVHQNLRPHACKTCGKNFKTNGQLKAHMETHSDFVRLAPKSHHCSICGNGFTTKGHLKYHFQMHFAAHREPIHMCDICGKGLVTREALKKHMLIHCDVKPYKCQVCDKHFKRNCERRKHELYHMPEEEKPHKCTFCGKAYPTKFGLKDHLMSFSHNLSKEEAKSLAGISQKKVVIVGNEMTDMSLSECGMMQTSTDSAN